MLFLIAIVFAELITTVGKFCESGKIRLESTGEDEIHSAHRNVRSRFNTLR